MRAERFILSGLVLLIGASLVIGAANLWSGQLDTGLVVAVSRIPRTLATILAGAGLAWRGSSFN